MKLLLIFPFLPYPPNDGGHIGFFNPIKYLSRRHEVSVACLTGDADLEDSVETLRQFCAELRTYRRRASRESYQLLRGMALWPPGSAAKYWYRGFGELIRNMVEVNGPDIVEFHHLNTAAYRMYVGNCPAILREHNVEYKVWERHAEAAEPFWERSFVRWTAPRVRRYEARASESVDRCVVVTPADAEHLRAVAPRARIEVIPSGVDTEYFYPEPQIEEEPFSITLTGSFEWQPKRQSLSVLLTEVFPRIRAKAERAKLYVVGKGVPEALRRVAERTPGVTVIGAVPDVRPYVWRSSLVINYLESGGGIALKVLEAMSMRKAVLTNALGCEGLRIQPGREIFVADGPEAFASAAAELLHDDSARRLISENGYQSASRHYSWSAISGQFDRTYEALIAEKDAFRIRLRGEIPRLEGTRGSGAD